jgi:hypothetical protein
MISEALQQRILQAVEKTASLVDDGMPPNEAIAQAIVFHKLGADCVAPLVHAYNTGRTTHQRENGHDPFEKAADFELADTGTILKQLFPPVVAIKQAADCCKSETASPQYACTPAGLIDRHKKKRIALSRPSPVVEKGATVVKEKQITTGDIDRAKIKAAQARQHESECFDKFAVALDAVVNHIKGYQSKSLTLIEKHAGMLFGDAAAPIISFVKENNPLLCKQSRHLQTGKPGEAADSAAVKLIKSAIDASAAAVEAAEARSVADAIVSKLTVKLAMPYAQQVNNSMLQIEEDELLQKAAIGNFSNLMDVTFGNVAAQNLNSQLTPSQPSEMAEKEFLRLMDPAHEAQLRNIRAEATLNELLANDDVISGYGDDEVLDAYNDIVQNAPAVADNRLALQALMRQRLQQGASSPFELEQLGNINRGLSATHGSILPSIPAYSSIGNFGGSEQQPNFASKPPKPAPVGKR